MTAFAADSSASAAWVSVSRRAVSIAIAACAPRETSSATSSRAKGRSVRFAEDDQLRQL